MVTPTGSSSRRRSGGQSSTHTPSTQSRRKRASPGRPGRPGRPAQSTSQHARESHLETVEALSEGISQLEGVIDKLSRLKSGEGDRAEGESRDWLSMDALSAMTEVIDENPRPSLEYTLGVVGAREVPRKLAERQRSQGARAFTVHLRNRAIRKKREAMEEKRRAAKEKGKPPLAPVREERNSTGGNHAKVGQEAARDREQGRTLVGDEGEHKSSDELAQIVGLEPSDEVKPEVVKDAQEKKSVKGEVEPVCKNVQRPAGLNTEGELKPELTGSVRVEDTGTVKASEMAEDCKPVSTIKDVKNVKAIDSKAKIVNSDQGLNNVSPDKVVKSGEDARNLHVIAVQQAEESADKRENPEPNLNTEAASVKGIVLPVQSVKTKEGANETKDDKIIPGATVPKPSKVVSASDDVNPNEDAVAHSTSKNDVDTGGNGSNKAANTKEGGSADKMSNVTQVRPRKGDDDMNQLKPSANVDNANAIKPARDAASANDPQSKGASVSTFSEFLTECPSVSIAPKLPDVNNRVPGHTGEVSKHSTGSDGVIRNNEAGIKAGVVVKQKPAESDKKRRDTFNLAILKKAINDEKGQEAELKEPTSAPIETSGPSMPDKKPSQDAAQAENSQLMVGSDILNAPSKMLISKEEGVSADSLGTNKNDPKLSEEKRGTFKRMKKETTKGTSQMPPLKQPTPTLKQTVDVPKAEKPDTESSKTGKAETTRSTSETLDFESGKGEKGNSEGPKLKTEGPNSKQGEAERSRVVEMERPKAAVGKRSKASETESLEVERADTERSKDKQTNVERSKIKQVESTTLRGDKLDAGKSNVGKQTPKVSKSEKLGPEILKAEKQRTEKPRIEKQRTERSKAETLKAESLKTEKQRAEDTKAEKQETGTTEFKKESAVALKNAHQDNDLDPNSSDKEVDMLIDKVIENAGNRERLRPSRFKRIESSRSDSSDPKQQRRTGDSQEKQRKRSDLVPHSSRDQRRGVDSTNDSRGPEKLAMQIKTRDGQGGSEKPNRTPHDDQERTRSSRGSINNSDEKNKEGTNEVKPERTGVRTEKKIVKIPKSVPRNEALAIQMAIDSSKRDGPGMREGRKEDSRESESVPDRKSDGESNVIRTEESGNMARKGAVRREKAEIAKAEKAEKAEKSVERKEQSKSECLLRRAFFNLKEESDTVEGLKEQKKNSEEAGKAGSALKISRKEGGESSSKPRKNKEKETPREQQRRVGSRRLSFFREDFPDMSSRRTRLRRESSHLRDPTSLPADTDTFIVKCYHVWKDINQDKITIPFRKPVTKKDAPGYFDVIKHPMDLSTVRQHLEDKTIKNPLDFYNEMILICDNATTFNDKETDLYELAVELRGKFRKAVKPVLKEWRKFLATKNKGDEKGEGSNPGSGEGSLGESASEKRGPPSRDSAASSGSSEENSMRRGGARYPSRRGGGVASRGGGRGKRKFVRGRGKAIGRGGATRRADSDSDEDEDEEAATIAVGKAVSRGRGRRNFKRSVKDPPTTTVKKTKRPRPGTEDDADESRKKRRFTIRK